MHLALIRHGESEYNVKGLWTGWDNPPLTQKGHMEARITGEKLKTIDWDLAYVSDLLRAQQTLTEIKDVINKPKLPTVVSSEIKERNYGIFTGKNKWEVQKELGEEDFLRIRRSWDSPPPKGESLKDVYERETPYYEQEILPKIKQSKNILFVSSGNSLRAMVKYLENVPEQEISKLEIPTGYSYLYELDLEGKVKDKQILSIQHDYKQ